MTTLELKTLETDLQTRSRQLVRSLGRRNEITIERAADALDETALAVQRESSALMLAQEFHLLREIEAARNRIRDGTFGICLRCEASIAPKRLQALPWAAHCVSCQAQAEEDQTLRPRLERAA